MRVQDGHAHAYSRYERLNWRHYFYLFISIFVSKMKNYRSLTVHLPWEIQHPQHVSNFKKGMSFINFGERLKKILKIKLYWENAPALSEGIWDLKYENTDWQKIPKHIEICLDTGHLMLGCKSKEEFLNYLELILKQRDTQIKHLHIHENNFRSDNHNMPNKILDSKLLSKLKQGRTFIYEKSS